MGAILVVPAIADDRGAADSVYFGRPRYAIVKCPRGVKLTLPVFLRSDQYANLLNYRFNWSIGTACDAVKYDSTSNCASGVTTTLQINNGSRYTTGSMNDYCGLVSTIRTEQIMECTFSLQLGDTLHVWFDKGSTGFRLSEPSNYWRPTVDLLDSHVVVPDTVLVMAGDTDYNGLVTISDALFLINYMFARGCPPYDRNVSDVSGDCVVTISDIVYLVNYIFSSGQAPLPGCVVW